MGQVWAGFSFEILAIGKFSYSVYFSHDQVDFDRFSKTRIVARRFIEITKAETPLQHYDLLMSDELC